MTTPEIGVAGHSAFASARSRAINALRGTVLEIGAGDGANFDDLDRSVTWLGLEPSQRRRARLGDRARSYGHHTPPLAALAEAIPLPDASVDAVIATAALCSVHDQHRVLAEIGRVLVPGGTVVLAEHVAAPPGTATRRAQRVIRPFSRLFDHGCDPLHDTEAAVRGSGLQIRSVERHLIPMFARVATPVVVIVAVSRPPSPDTGAASPVRTGSTGSMGC